MAKLSFDPLQFQGRRTGCQFEAKLQFRDMAQSVGYAKALAVPKLGISDGFLQFDKLFKFNLYIFTQGVSAK